MKVHGKAAKPHQRAGCHASDATRTQASEDVFMWSGSRPLMVPGPRDGLVRPEVGRGVGHAVDDGHPIALPQRPEALLRHNVLQCGPQAQPLYMPCSSARQMQPRYLQSIAQSDLDMKTLDTGTSGG